MAAIDTVVSGTSNMLALESGPSQIASSSQELARLPTQLQANYRPSYFSNPLTPKLSPAEMQLYSADTATREGQKGNNRVDT